MLAFGLAVALSASVLETCGREKWYGDLYKLPDCLFSGLSLPDVNERCGFANGGALFTLSPTATLVVTDSYFSDCFGQNGGGVYFVGAAVTVRNCLVSNCSACMAGSFAWLQPSSQATVTSTAILIGTCLNGTILLNSSGARTISLSAINGSYNVVQGDSSGIRVLSHSGITFEDARFESNEGGCVVWPGAHPDGSDSLNCLFFVNNTAGGSRPEGGSIFCAGASYTLTNCVFLRNSGALLGIVPAELTFVTFSTCIFDAEPSTTGSNASVIYLSRVILASGVGAPAVCPWPTATEPSGEGNSFVGTLWFYVALGGGGFIIVLVVVVIIALRCCPNSGSGSSDWSVPRLEVDEEGFDPPPASNFETQACDQPTEVTGDGMESVCDTTMELVNDFL